MNTILDEWETFVDQALRPDISEQDKKAVQMAFYAGAWALLGLQHKLAIEGYSEAAGTAIVGGIYEEMLLYFKEIQHEE